jgi:hypothetical protein
MLCETCQWAGRRGFVRGPRGDNDMIPCPDCGGTGIAHCCDGICEQPQLGPLGKPARDQVARRNFAPHQRDP